MLDLYKRFWQVFLPLFALFGLGSLQSLYYLNGYDYQWIVFAILLLLTIICLIVGIIGLVKAIKDGRRKDKEAKAAKEHEDLKESIRRMNPEWTEQQVEIAATGRTEPYQPIDGLDDDGWITPREAYKK